ncbi:MAG: nuclear transport factor 2 family protein [Burkholderiaceae bacterium]
MSDSILQEIEAVDAERRAATIAADRATLQRVLSDDLRYTHSSAITEDKATYIDLVCSGHYKYSGMTNGERGGRVMGDIALLYGDARLDVQVKGTPKSITTRYLAVWRREDGRWRMLAWHSTAIPA